MARSSLRKMDDQSIMQLGGDFQHYFHFNVVQSLTTLFEGRLQELNRDFAKICISGKPSMAPMGKVPLLVAKEFEQQARQNLCTVNFRATFSKTAWKSAKTVSSLVPINSKAKFKKVRIGVYAYWMGFSNIPHLSLFTHSLVNNQWCVILGSAPFQYRKVYNP